MEWEWVSFQIYVGYLLMNTFKHTHQMYFSRIKKNRTKQQKEKRCSKSVGLITVMLKCREWDSHFYILLFVLLA